MERNVGFAKPFRLVCKPRHLSILMFDLTYQFRIIASRSQRRRDRLDRQPHLGELKTNLF